MASLGDIQWKVVKTFVDPVPDADGSACNPCTRATSAPPVLQVQLQTEEVSSAHEDNAKQERRKRNPSQKERRRHRKWSQTQHLTSDAQESQEIDESPPVIRSEASSSAEIPVHALQEQSPPVHEANESWHIMQSTLALPEQAQLPTTNMSPIPTLEVPEGIAEAFEAAQGQQFSSQLRQLIDTEVACVHHGIQQQQMQMRDILSSLAERVEMHRDTWKIRPELNRLRLFASSYNQNSAWLEKAIDDGDFAAAQVFLTSMAQKSKDFEIVFGRLASWLDKLSEDLEAPRKQAMEAQAQSEVLQQRARRKQQIFSNAINVGTKITLMGAAVVKTVSALATAGFFAAAAAPVAAPAAVVAAPAAVAAAPVAATSAAISLPALLGGCLVVVGGLAAYAVTVVGIVWLAQKLDEAGKAVLAALVHKLWGFEERTHGRFAAHFRDLHEKLHQCQQEFTSAGVNCAKISAILQDVHILADDMVLTAEEACHMKNGSAESDLVQQRMGQLAAQLLEKQQQLTSAVKEIDETAQHALENAPVQSMLLAASFAAQVEEQA